MAKNVMKLLKPSPKHGKNAFDLSHRNIFAMNFGELLPACVVETVPDDKVEIEISDLLRCAPMVTSPFLRAKQNYDFWFVPYSALWSRFNEFLVDKSEPSSSAYKNRLYLPHFSTRILHNALNGSVIPNIMTGSPEDYATRLLDLLGYAGTLWQVRDPDQYGGASFVNPFRLAAFNMIWYHEYRQKYYDDGTFGIPASVIGALGSSAVASLWNFDHLSCDTEENASLNNLMPLVAAMLQPRYRCWKKDLFTGLMPSTQFGNVSVVDVNLTSDINAVRGLLVNKNGLYYSNSVAEVNTVAGSSVTVPTTATTTGVTNRFDILALRKSEAIQKWRENALRAGNQVEDNFEAHYGVKPRTHINHHPVYLGSATAPVSIGDINAMAQTDAEVNGSLASVAGKGLSSFDGKKFTFETNDYGIVMGILSCLPEAEYNAMNLDPLNCLLEREDFFFPEYENLGLQPVESHFISSVGVNRVIGYAPRYFAYKQKLDRCCGQFMSNEFFEGTLRQWCSPKFDVDYSGSYTTMPLSVLYVNPEVFNVIFTYGDSDVNPQLLVDVFNKVTAVRPMSVSGMPSY